MRKQIYAAADKDLRMKYNREDVAAAIGRNEEVAEMLDTLMTAAADRAYVVCSFSECLNNANGRCTIHLVRGDRTVPDNGRCADYVV